MSFSGRFLPGTSYSALLGLTVEQAQTGLRVLFCELQ